MAIQELVRESRAVPTFDRVVIKGYGELAIGQGAQQALTIETGPNLLPNISSHVADGALHLGHGGSWLDQVKRALKTSFTRMPIRYHLTVTDLTGLEIYGVFSVKAENICTECLFLKSLSVSQVRFVSLVTELLEVALPVSGAVEMSGTAREQKITISGPGNYHAPRLACERATVRISGPGEAVVRAADDLDVVIRGPGRVAYYGAPRLRQQVSMHGLLGSLGAA